MTNRTYVGLDVHRASTSVAVHDSDGKLLMQSTIRTTPEALRHFIRGLSGSIHLTFEEGPGDASRWTRSPLTVDLGGI